MRGDSMEKTTKKPPILIIVEREFTRTKSLSKVFSSVIYEDLRNRIKNRTFDKKEETK